MKPLEIRNIRIGEGIPKICVPIVGKTKEEILGEAGKLSEVPADIAEWRADWYEDVFDVEKVKEVLKELRAILNETPLLFTIRTAKEGGEKDITPEKLEKIRALNELAKERGESLPQMALAWNLKDSDVTSVIIGASRPEQIRENCKVVESRPFTKEELDRIEEICRD